MIASPAGTPRLAIMVDTETLATATDAAITQIAAVMFDLDTGEIHSAGLGEFNVFIKTGFGVVQRSTALWWMQQRHGAAFAARVEANGVDLHAALGRFTAWLADVGAIGRGPSNLPLYAHGAPFDFPVLRTSFEACQMVPPWSYREELCCRAFYKELPAGDGKPPVVPDPPGYAQHDALSDCRKQVAQLVAARVALGLAKEAA